MEDNLFIVANNKQRLTQKEKDANDKQWYKDQADLLDRHSFSNASLLAFGGVTDFTRKKVNYDLFNNFINPTEFEYVSKPFGATAGQLPAQFANRDIVSSKIKVLLGMEMEMPFSWTVVATNEEAYSRKSEEEFGRIRDYVVGQVMQPIKTKIAQQQLQQQKQQQSNNPNAQLTPEDQQNIQDQINDEVSSQTPDGIRKYMTMKHRDPAESMSEQILRYLIQKERIPEKFNKGFKHLCLGGTQIYHVGEYNDDPCLTVANTLYFDHDMSPDLDYIEDGEWAVHEYRMTPSQAISLFGSELTEDEIDRIYEYNTNPSNIQTGDFTFSDRHQQAYTVKVLHTTWKSLQKVGFLIYNSKDTGKEELMLVDENYKLDKANGDVSIQWEWIPEAHECYKILGDIYVFGRPVSGQNRDLDNLYICKLPYYGASVDDLNSPITSPMDRIKGYQYYYDVICYRIELLMASDKGKILAANIKHIPKSAGIDTEKFLYFMEANKIAFLNPNEEGNRGGNPADITNVVKEIDLSLASHIQEYIALAEYIEKKCGGAIGVTPQMEAAIAANEAVTNTKQNIIQASHIMRPYYELHNNVKRNVLQALIDKAKTVYSRSKKRYLTYVLDDLSRHTFEVDPGLLDSSTLGLFVSNAAKAQQAKQEIVQLSQAAMQNQQADLLDVINILTSDSLLDVKEDLEISIQKKAEENNRAEKAKLQQAKEAELRADTLKREQWTHEKDMILLKAEEDRKTKVEVESIAALGYAKNTDVNQNNVPDVLEVAKFGVDKAESIFEQGARSRELDQEDKRLQLEQGKLEHQKKNDAEKNAIERKKLDKPSPSK